MKKWILTLVFLFFVCVGFDSFEGYAYEYDTEKYEKMKELLKPYVEEMISNPNAFELEGVDSKQLYIGKEFYSYTMQNGVPVKDISVIYPIFCGEEIIFNAIYAEVDGQPAINVTNFLVDEFNEKYEKKKELILIANADYYYIYSDSTISLVSEIPPAFLSNEKQIRATNTVLKNRLSEQIEELNTLQKIDLLFSGSASISENSRATNDIILPVQIVGQWPYRYYCWIACVTCIGNYLEDDVEYGTNIATMLANRSSSKYVTETGSINDFKTLLYECYGITYNSALLTQPTQTKIRNNLSIGKPLALVFGGTATHSSNENAHTSVNHMVVARGISADNKILYLIDPWGRDQYLSGMYCTATWIESTGEYLYGYTWTESSTTSVGYIYDDLKAHSSYTY